jgi:hypothetical protein
VRPEKIRSSLGGGCYGRELLPHAGGRKASPSRADDWQHAGDIGDDSEHEGKAGARLGNADDV